MHGGDLIVRALESIGVEKIFGLPGAQTNPIYDAIGRSDKIQHIQVRDERSGVFAADAYARVTGRIGVCDATLGPGATNITTGLYEALNSSVPLIAIIAGVETHLMNFSEKTRASQGIDQASMLRPVCKKFISVASVDRISESIRIAAITACSGTPGPVVVEFASNIIREQADERDIRDEHYIDAVYPLHRIPAPADKVREAAQLLLAAERPLIAAGGGIHLSHAADKLTEFAELNRIPVITTYSGKGAMAETHPLCLGFTGSIGIPMNEQLARQADVVLMVGVKNSQNLTFNWTFPELGQKVIHLDIDPEDLNRVFRTEVCLPGDARTVLEQLIEETKNAAQPDRGPWLKLVKEMKDAWQELKNKEQQSAKQPILPQRVMKAIQSVLDDDTCIVADASFASAWVAEHLEFDKAGRRCLFPRGSAGLGWSLPAAIGVAASGKFKKVIVVAGDGGYGYSVNELATLRQHGYPIVSVVLNNSTWGWMKWLGQMTYEKEPVSTDLVDINFAAVSEGFGLPGIHVTDPARLEESLVSLLDSGKGGVLNVVTAWDEAPDFNYRKVLSMKQSNQAALVKGYVAQANPQT
jgi:acetolactate synthase-1/2/3 large subunit